MFDEQIYSEIVFFQKKSLDFESQILAIFDIVLETVSVTFFKKWNAHGVSTGISIHPVKRWTCIWNKCGHANKNASCVSLYDSFRIYFHTKCLPAALQSDAFFLFCSVGWSAAFKFFSIWNIFNPLWTDGQHQTVHHRYVTIICPNAEWIWVPT